MSTQITPGNSGTVPLFLLDAARVQEATAMNLSTPDDGKKTRYSPLEQKVFRVLDKKPKSTVVITDEIWGRSSKRPDTARQSIVGALKNLARKTRKNKEPFKIKNSKRQGPHPVDYWIE